MIDLEVFQSMRQEVLASWPTGGRVSEEAFEYYRSRDDRGAFDQRLREAKASGRTLLQPRGGVPLVKHQVELLQFLEEKGTADLLPLTVDSYTRQNRYEAAERHLKASRESDSAQLNGFPVVNQGVERCRAVLEEVASPVEIRHGTPDARLLAEISYAAGYTSFEGGGITYNLPYSARVPLERSIRHWQYVDRLSGYYTARGIIINRESYGALTGILVPPAIVVAISVLEALLAAEQGVTSVTVGYGQIGHVIQDVAALQVLDSLTEEYLCEFGYDIVDVTTAFHQWMGPFPMLESRALSLIGLGTLTAVLAGATKVITKTPHEAIGVPTKEANAKGLLCSRLVVDILTQQQPLDRVAVEREAAWIEDASRSLIDSSLELGEGDFGLSVTRAFEAGVLDLPFSPSEYAHGEVLPIRDAEGAVRYLDHGRLPLANEFLERNEELVQKRLESESGLDPAQLIEQDVNYFIEHDSLEESERLGL